MEYPQSSCLCETCPHKPPLYTFNQAYPSQVIPSNLTTNGCELPPEFTCTNLRKLSQNEQPILPPPHKITLLNPTMGIKRAEDFYICDRKCQKQKVHDIPPPLSNKVYGTYDPRTYNSPRATWLLLDQPVYTGEVPLNDIYNKDLAGYGQNYTSYADINTGQYQYYLDKSLSPVLFNPLFTIKSEVDSGLFVDPMGSRKFVTQRIPLLVNNRYISDYQFDRDQMEFRENLIHSQMAVPNQQDYNHAWSQVN